jgi:hypothetical protein
MRIFASATALFATASALCNNLDGWSTGDIGGDLCDWYETYSGSCGIYDDDDFQAYDMCCVCGGGYTVDIHDHPMSTAYDYPIEVYFYNGASYTADIYWHDYDGNLVYYNTLEPYETYTQQTYATHPWSAQTGDDRRQLLTYGYDVFVPTEWDNWSTIWISDKSCSDTNGWATDTTYDDCSWYDGYPDTCGSYDDSDFASNDMCCSCGGGTQVDGAATCDDTTWGATDITWDGCEWYDAYPSGCGNYDDDDFASNDMCCSCGGGSTAQVDSCANTNYGATDWTYDDCSWYDLFPSSCGNYDDDDFWASDMCCSCGGGSGHGNGCTDANYGATDVTYDDCAWYDSYPDSCGYWDDDDFSSNDMCCACGGGDGCTDTAYGATDLTYDDCSWYDAWPEGCGIWDDEDFSSMEMCCGCGGGYGCALSLIDYHETTATDLGGDGCDWYWTRMDQCSVWDDDDFSAYDDCMACGGGYCHDTEDAYDSYEDGCDWYEADPAGRCNGAYDWAGFTANEDCCACEYYWYAAVSLHEDETCYDSDPNYCADTGGDYCYWYAEGDNHEYCGRFDDDDFNAEVYCCACGGGSSTSDATCYWDTSDYATDLTEDGCEWYDAYPDSCGYWDDEDFDAVNMCCSCGGGYRQGQC